MINKLNNIFHSFLQFFPSLYLNLHNLLKCKARSNSSAILILFTIVMGYSASNQAYAGEVLIATIPTSTDVRIDAGACSTRSSIQIGYADVLDSLGNGTISISDDLSELTTSLTHDDCEPDGSTSSCFMSFTYCRPAGLSLSTVQTGTVTVSSSNGTSDSFIFNGRARTVTCHDGSLATAASACPACPAGTSGNGVTCTPDVTCHDGSTAPNAASCPACPSGTTGDGVTCTPTTSDVTCHDGSTASNAASCPACPSGTTGNGVTCTPTTSDVTCHDGSTASNAASCPACPSGTTGDGVTCTPTTPDTCWDGSSAAGGTCPDCPIGYSGGGTGTCTAPCSDGSTVTHPTTCTTPTPTPTPCDLGGSTNGTCGTCWDGMTSTSSSLCPSCPSGYTGGGFGTCTAPCTHGGNVTAPDECVSCVAGETATSEANCPTFPVLNITPASHDFGDVAVLPPVAPSADIPTLAYQVSNTGTGPAFLELSLTGDYITGSDQFRIDTSGANSCIPSLIIDFPPFSSITTTTIPAGSSCNIYVQCTSTEIGTHNGTLGISFTNHDSLTAAAACNVVSTTLTPTLELTPETFDFGQVSLTAPVTQSFSIANTGTGTGDNFSISEDSTAYSVVSHTCGTSLTAGETCAATVEFAPTGGGTFNATLTASITGITDTSSLTGVGITPEIDVTPTSIIFPATRVGLTSADRTVTVTNQGTAPLNLSSMSLFGGNTADFNIVSENCTAAPIAASGGTCEIIVNSTPTNVGIRTINLSLISDDADEGTVNVSLRVTGLAPEIAVAPLSIDFGDVANGSLSSIETVTITNSGGFPLDVTGLTLGGANAADYSIASDDCVAGTVPANGGTCTVNLQVTPSALGNRTATLTVASDDADEPTVSVSLTVNSIAPEIDVTPTSVTFPDTLIGALTSNQTITVTNQGTGLLNLSSVTLNGGDIADFNIVSENCTAAPIAASGGTCEVVVNATPTALGSLTTNLRLLSDDADEGTLDVPLSVTGITPEIAVAPLSIDFGDVANGSLSSTETVTITNSGGFPLDVTGLTLGGTHAADYSIASENCIAGTVPANGGTCTVNLQVTPSALGNRTATLTVASDDADEANVSVSLAANSVEPEIDVTPSVIPFGDQNLNTTSANQIITVSNTGDAPLTVSGVDIDRCQCRYV